MKKLLLVAGLAGAGLVAINLPDIQRYLRIRAM